MACSSELDDSSKRLAEQGWVADYPPWFWKSWIEPAKCRTEDEAARLLHLLRSIEYGQPKQTRKLLPGIDPNLRLGVKGTETESLLEWAAEKARHDDCIRLLVAAGASLKAPKLVSKLVCSGRTELLRELIASGADPSVGENALLSACRDQPEIVRLLLNAGTPTNVTTTVYITNAKKVTKVTPLMLAAYIGQFETVDLLLRAGVDVNAVDEAGNSAIEWAKISRARKKAIGIIQLLERAGAHDGTRSSKLPAPVDFAARARKATFRKALTIAKAITKSAGKVVQLDTGPFAGAYAFRIHNPDSALAVLDEVRAKVTSLGAFAFISESLQGMAFPSLVLVPTADYREAIVAFETPVGQSIDSYELIDWLTKLEKAQPFAITHIATDKIRARFTTPIRGSMKLAKSIQKICPDVTDAPLKKVAKHLEQSRELYLWWD